MLAVSAVRCDLHNCSYDEINVVMLEWLSSIMQYINKDLGHRCFKQILGYQGCTQEF